MIEVKAQLIGSSVLLAGDIVQVCVTVSAPAQDPPTSLESRSGMYEVIGWSSAQIHCTCMVNDNVVSISPSRKKSLQENSVSNSSTSFAPWTGENGHIVLATKPKILFCDLQLIPGESRSFIYREKLPVDAPPSYRGRLVKYSYKVTVGTQRLGSPINHLKLPLRVIVLQGLALPVVHSDTEDLAPTNPFLYAPQKENTRQTVLDQLQNISTMKNTSQYNISHAKGHVAKFTVHKSSYRLGEDIVATFDFTKSDLSCVQFSATLQSEEEISKNCCQKVNQKSVVVPYTKTHEVCLSFSHTNFMLPIPLHVTPTFDTDIVSLKWSIHFEFVLNIEGNKSKIAAEDFMETSTGNISWNAPSKLKIETLVWDLPITVCPTIPSQLSQAVGIPSPVIQQI